MALLYPDKVKSNNPAAYGIVDAVEVSGHKQVADLTALYALKDCILSKSGTNADNDAIGQEWYVVSDNHYYRLNNWANRRAAGGWVQIADVNYNAQQVTEIKTAMGKKADLENGKLAESQMPLSAREVYYFVNQEGTGKVTEVLDQSAAAPYSIVFSWDKMAFVAKKDGKYYAAWGDSALTWGASVAGTGVKPAAGKLYIDQTTKDAYGWVNSAFAVISPKLGIGEGSSQAFAGNRGKALENKMGSLPGDIVSGVNAVWRNGEQINLGFPYYRKNADTGLWELATDSKTIVLPKVTTTQAGLMTAADKQKLDGLSNYELPVMTLEELMAFPSAVADVLPYVNAQESSRFIVTQNGRNVGVLDMFSDTSAHVLTQMFTTHFSPTGSDGMTLDLSSANLGHRDDQIYTYFRSYNANNAPHLDVDAGKWTGWTVVGGSLVWTAISNTLKGVNALPTNLLGGSSNGLVTVATTAEKATLTYKYVQKASANANFGSEQSVSRDIPAATTSNAGVMSAADKKKLDGLETFVAMTEAEIDAICV